MLNYLKLVTLCTAILVVCRIMFVQEQDVPQSTVEPTIDRDAESKRELQLFVHKMDRFRDFFESIQTLIPNIFMSDSSDRLAIKQITGDVHTIWRNTQCHVINYDFDKNASSLAHKEKSRQSRRSKRHNPSRQFGRVVIRTNHSMPLTSGTSSLSTDTFISPSDYLCRHAASDADSYTTVTLATTMLFNDKTFILNNTLRNWSRLRPFVQPVLYVTPSDSQAHAPAAIQLACSLGWDVYLAPECNEDNFPVLRSMMADMLSKYSAPMVGYANGDILFDTSLPRTLQFFVRHRGKLLPDSKSYHLITGRRKDLTVSVGDYWVGRWRKRGRT